MGKQVLKPVLAAAQHTPRSSLSEWKEWWIDGINRMGDSWKQDPMKADNPDHPQHQTAWHASPSFFVYDD